MERLWLSSHGTRKNSQVSPSPGNYFYYLVYGNFRKHQHFINMKKEERNKKKERKRTKETESLSRRWAVAER